MQRMQPGTIKATPNPRQGEGMLAKHRARWQLGRIDVPLLLIVLGLLIFGLIMLFSASYPSGLLRLGDSYYYIRKQLQYVAIGIPAMFAVSLFDYRHLKKFAWPVMLVSIVLLVVVLFMAEQKGVKRWIWLGDPSSQRGFQPSEIAKFAMILLFAYLLEKYRPKIKTFRYGFLPFIAILGIIAVLLLLEPHLSCTILMLGIGFIMMVAGGVSPKWFLLMAGILVLVALIAFGPLQELVTEELVPYAQTRIDTWLDPVNADPDDAHQTMQSLIAVGSGGPFGRGIGQSKQKFLYLPEMYNDYIYAVLCEELGMIGGIGVMVLFLLLLGRCLYLAATCKDRFGAMLIVGVAVQISLQAFLHIAVNINAIPSTGISLPFFSYGGTALCMLLGQVGILLSVTRRRDLDIRKEKLATITEEPVKQPPPQPKPVYQRRVQRRASGR